MGFLKVLKASVADAPLPGADEVTLFVDTADGKLKSKDELGVVITQGVGTADAIATSGAPVDFSAGAPPAAGYIPAALTPTTGAFVDPAIYGALKEVATVVGPAAHNAVIGTYIPVDLAGGAVTITLPTAVGKKDKVIGVKLRSAALSLCQINPILGQLIDEFANWQLLSDREVVYLRSNNVGWDIAG